MQDITRDTVNSFGTLNRNFGAEYLQVLKDAVIQIYIPKRVPSSFKVATVTPTH